MPRKSEDAFAKKAEYMATYNKKYREENRAHIHLLQAESRDQRRGLPKNGRVECPDCSLLYALRNDGTVRRHKCRPNQETR